MLGRDAVTREMALVSRSVTLRDVIDMHRFIGHPSEKITRDTAEVYGAKAPVSGGTVRVAPRPNRDASVSQPRTSAPRETVSACLQTWGSGYRRDLGR